jgi:hypothetical protein
MRSGKRRTLLAGAGWVAAAVLATLIGMGGIRLIGDSLTSTPGGVLDQQDVAKALAASPSPTPGTPRSPAGTPSSTSRAPAAGSASAEPPSTGTSSTGTSSTGPRTPAAGNERGFSSTGGSVIAGCRDGVPYLVSWAPSPGYRVTQQEAESEHVDVRFEGSGGRSEIRVACSGNTPVQQDHGGGRGK